MNALAKLLTNLLPWQLSLNLGFTHLGSYDLYLWICSGVVLIYVLKGGLTSAIYTEVLQFFMIVLGFAPVVYLALKDVGGWSAMTTQLHAVAQNPQALDLNTRSFGPDAWTSAWKPLLSGTISHPDNPMGVDWMAVVFGLGFVSSFGYWCTNFLVVQRAMAAKNMTAARNTPLIAAVPKMLFPVLVILPGMLAVALTALPSKDYRIPPPIIAPENYAKAVDVIKTTNPPDPATEIKNVSDALGQKVNADKITALITANAATTLSDDQIKLGIYNAVAAYDYDSVIFSLVKKYCPAGLLGLALTALLASFMSGMAGNVTAFNTVWTYNLYQAFFVPNKSDQHYFWMAKFITIVGIALSIGCAYFARQYNNAMDIIQLVFGFVNAPVFGTFLLGMFWKRTTSIGAFCGLLGGIIGSTLFHAFTIAQGNLPGVKGGYLGVKIEFFSEMAQNFWLAAFAFSVCFVLTVVISLATQRTKSDDQLKGLVYSLTPKIVEHDVPVWQRPAVVGIVLLIACVILNIIFW